jgi:helicase
MENLIEIVDSLELVPTTEIKYGHWPFPSFNPVQSALAPYIEQDLNGLVAAATSCGKTVISEMFASYVIRKLKKKFIFLCPLRALANEKYNDWTNPSHHFSDLNIGIYTGDYSEKEGYENNDIIIMTSEMLNHKVRLAKKGSFLEDVKIIVVDESHMLTVEDRGPHLECALLTFSKINPESRLILLSGTLPNVHEVAEWLNKLNNKKTFIIKSDYRPCQLKIHSLSYSQDCPVNISISDECIRLVQRYHSDKFLIFVHSKAVGNFIISALENKNIQAEFHNANLNKEQRESIENKFKNDKNFRIIVATSTLAQGLNLPARRVIVAGVHRGPQIVPSYDILQMCGRAGRPAFDPQGDAYVLFPEYDQMQLAKVCLAPCEVRSKMLETSDMGDYATLAFHLMAEIYDGRVTSLQEAKLWLERSLAIHQNMKASTVLLEETLDKLVRLGILRKSEKDKKYTITNLGKVSVMYYVSPFTVASWSKNFTQLFQNDKIHDIQVCLALTDTSDNLIGAMSKEDKMLMKTFIENVGKLSIKNYSDNVIKHAFMYYRLLFGNIEQKYYSQSKTLQNDFPRTTAILQAIDSWSKKWNKSDFLRTFAKRIQHGCPAKLLDLIDIKGVGRVKAEKLYDAGFKSKSDIKNNITAASKVAGINQDSLQKNIG